MRGAETSFVPDSYFENAELDRDKWEALFRRLTGRELGSALDVGCGTGAFLAHLGQRYPNASLEGIELDAGRADQASLAVPGARIHNRDALAGLEEARGPYDLITLWDVFEHVEAPALLLRKMADVLSDEGILYLQTINERSVTPFIGRASYRASFGRVRSMARRTHEPHHLVFFTKRGLQRASEDAGLEIQEIWFDRLHRGRMDGSALLTGLTSLLLQAENALGGGLFINLLLSRRR